MTTSALALPFLCLLCVLHSLPTSCSIPSSSPSSLHISSPSILSIPFGIVSFASMFLSFHESVGEMRLVVWKEEEVMSKSEQKNFSHVFCIKI